MDFREFKIKFQKHVSDMIKDSDHLFVTEIDKDKIWNLYLDSFPEGNNIIFRERREYDCSACRSFIKSFGNVVTIKNNKVTSIWDFQTEDSIYQPVVNALSQYIHSKVIENVFVTKISQYGVDKNFEQVEGKDVITWEHISFKLPGKFVNNLSGDTLGTIIGNYRDIRNVFKRSLEEITEESVLTILELIAQKSLYKGEEWKNILDQFYKHQKAYNKLTNEQKELYAWEQSVIVGGSIAKIKNHSIGVLLSDISEGTELDQAVRKYESIVAPSNYKRPKAIFTQKMLEDAKKQLESEGYLESLERRYATLDDITINNILFANRDSSKRILGSVFDEMSTSIAINPKNFSKVEEVSIDTFVKDILPTSTKVELLLENKHSRNFISLIAPEIKDSKTMFKWDNNFSWAYSGNITDSMKERVKSFGGNVSGVLRFSIQWNDNGDNLDDLDAHCIQPYLEEIYYGNKGYRHKSSGMLDVDIINPTSQTKDGVAVENIIFSDINSMPEGTYKFFVNCFSHRGGKSGFSAEVEFDGTIYSFTYNNSLHQNENIAVANVTYSRKEGFKIIEKLPSSTSSRKVWSLDTNQFHPVSVIMYSPNYWNEQNGIGNKHYFFMLKNCINSESPNGFFNEYLKEDLMKHKRVFEALGSRMRVKDVDDQLSGIGFSSTQRNSIVVKVEGHLNRTLKINI